MRAPQRSPIGDREAVARSSARRRLVGKAPAANGRRRVGILVGGPLAPQPDAAPRAVAGDERAAQLHLVELVAAALAEDRAHEPRRRDDVGHLPRVGPERPADRRVLAGHLRDVQARLVDVRVDARDVGGQVGLQLAALRAVELAEPVGLALQVCFGIGRLAPLVLVHRAVARRAAREGAQPGAPAVAQDFDEEQPVLGGDVAQPEHRRDARRAVDVGHPVGAVARDRQALARTVRTRLVARRHAEARVLEELPEVAVGHPGGRAEQALVEGALVVVVRRAPARAEKRGELDEVGAPVGSRRKHVAKAAEVVGAIGLDRRCSGSDRPAAGRDRDQACDPRRRNYRSPG